MQAVRELHLSSVSFRIPHHTVKLFSAHTLVESRKPKCNTSTFCFFSFSGIFSVSSKYQSVPFWQLIENRKYFFGKAFFRSLIQIFKWNQFGSTEDLCASAFGESNLRLNNVSIGFPHLPHFSPSDTRESFWVVETPMFFLQLCQSALNLLLQKFLLSDWCACFNAAACCHFRVLVFSSLFLVYCLFPRLNSRYASPHLFDPLFLRRISNQFPPRYFVLFCRVFGVTI